MNKTKTYLTYALSLRKLPLKKVIRVKIANLDQFILDLPFKTTAKAIKEMIREKTYMKVNRVNGKVKVIIFTNAK